MVCMQKYLGRKWVTGILLLGVLSFLLGIMATGWPSDVAATATNLPLRINVGSLSNYVTEEGIVYQADQAWSSANGFGYIGGYRYVGAEGHPMGGTEEMGLYNEQRRQWTEYRVSDLPVGDYLVTMHFGELVSHGPGYTRFDVVAENINQLRNFDPLLIVDHPRYALVYRFGVRVTDGTLNILSNRQVGEPHLAALEVAVHDPNSAVPNSVSELEILPSYGANLLNWADMPLADLAGYHVYRSGSPQGEPYTLLTAKPTVLSRYEDYDVTINKTYYYRVAAVDVDGREGALSAPMGSAAWSWERSTLPVIELVVAPEDMHFLYGNLETDDELQATLVYDGFTYPVGVRFRGNRRTYAKKSWKVKFENASPFPNVTELNLRSEFVDRGLVRSALSTDVMERMGVEPVGAEYVVLKVNGRYWGVYNNYEQPDENYLARTGRNPEATLYKSFWEMFVWQDDLEDYAGWYEKKSNPHTGFDDIISLVEFVNLATDDEFVEELPYLLDLDAYLNYYTAMAITSNADFTRHNVYFIHDLETGMWEIVPFDVDLSWGLTNNFDTEVYSQYPINIGAEGSSPMVIGGSNLLVTRLLEQPVFRQAYCQRLGEALTVTFNEAEMTALIDAELNRVTVAAERDWRKYGWDNQQFFLESRQQLYAFAQERRAYLQAEMGHYCAEPQPMVRINEVLVMNEGVGCDPAESEGGCFEPWIEIYNEGLNPVELGGMYISNDPNNPRQHRINGSLVVPPLATQLLWADGDVGQGNTHLSFGLAGSGSVGLYLADGVTLVDQLAYDETGVNISVGREGRRAVRAFRVPTPGWRNVLVGPQIAEVDYKPFYPQAGDEVTITVTITDDSQLVDLGLYVQMGLGVFEEETLLPIGNHRYQLRLTAPISGTRVQFYVEAWDDDGNVSRWPAEAPDEAARFVVAYERPNLVINEFMADNGGSLSDPHEPGDAPDWIELYNPGPHTVSLEGMSLSDNLDNPFQHRFGEEISVLPGSYFLLYADQDFDQGWQHVSVRLDADGEDVALFDTVWGGYELIDGYEYGDLEPDESWVRCPNYSGTWEKTYLTTPGQFNQHCGTNAPRVTSLEHEPLFPAAGESVTFWTSSTDTQSGWQVWAYYRTAPNVPFFRAPMNRMSGRHRFVLPAQAAGTVVEYYVVATDGEGFEVSYPAEAPRYVQRFVVGFADPQVRLHEIVGDTRMVYEDPAEAGEYPDWIELHNSGDEPLSLAGFSLTDNWVEPMKSPLDPSLVIPAGGYLRLWADDDVEQGVDHLNFKLSKYGASVALYADNGRVLVDRIELGRFIFNVSWGREGAEGPWRLQTCMTPAADNGCPALYLPMVIAP
ncbi:MAG TPA: CotH kinase family protein [Anaerolineae bacterium]|nr:CotH kinase family protein [Anaerolineae bacterium]